MSIIGDYMPKSRAGADPKLMTDVDAQVEEDFVEGYQDR
jgi:hypothetical protein